MKINDNFIINTFMIILTIFILVVLSVPNETDLEYDAQIYSRQNSLSELRISNTKLELEVKRVNELLCRYVGHNWVFNYYPKEKTCLRCGVQVAEFTDEDINESISGTITNLRHLCKHGEVNESR